MAHYMVRWKFSHASIKKLMEKAEDRTEQARKLGEAFGVKLLNYYFCLGEYDGVAIVEAPNDEALVSMAAVATSSGGFTGWETTKLLTGAEAAAALRKAHDAKTAYRAPNA